ncbi:MAG: two-component regulator propeller domain-containing protein, partial [bacterium]
MYLSIQSLRLLSLTLLLWGVCPGLSFSQAVNIRAFHTRDGLADEVVRDIAQTSDGSVWFATWGGGISRFRGVNWETFAQSTDLPSRSVWALSPDISDGMWAGTTEGIAYFDGVEWHAVHPTIPDLATPSVPCITKLNNRALWFGTDDGRIIEFLPDISLVSSEVKGRGGPGVPKGTWSIVLDTDLTQGNDVRAILQVAENEIWAAVCDLAIAVYDGNQWQ